MTVLIRVGTEPQGEFGVRGIDFLNRPGRGPRHIQGDQRRLNAILPRIRGLETYILDLWRERAERRREHDPVQNDRHRRERKHPRAQFLRRLPYLVPGFNGDGRRDGAGHCLRIVPQDSYG